MDAELFVKELVSRARAAQQEFEKCTQEQVDEACRAIAKAICDNAEPLARMAVDETRMGVYEDKVKKNQGKARVIWNDMKGGKSVGIIGREPEKVWCWLRNRWASSARLRPPRTRSSPRCATRCLR